MFEQSTKFKRILIFDPCFGVMTGHWENYCKRLYQELVDRGYSVKVYGQFQQNRNITEDISFEPLFRHSPYDKVCDFLEFKQQTHLFLQDFKTIESQVADGDLLIFHSIFPQTLAAIINWTRELSIRKKVIITIFFQFPSSETKKNLGFLKKIYYGIRRLVNLKITTLLASHSVGEEIKELEWVNNRNVYYYQKSAKELKHLVDNNSHLLFASTEVLSRNFTLLLGSKVHYLPMPGNKLEKLNTFQKPVYENVQLTVSSLRGAQRRSNPRGLLDCFVAALLAMTTQLVERSPVSRQSCPLIKIGYFGHSSLEKGGHFLRYLVEVSKWIYPQVQFILHINPNHATESYLNWFKSNPRSGVTCYYGHLKLKQIMDLMNEVDIILMPYSLHKYATTPSAVFTEGMPLKKIFIIPKNTWMHEEAKKYDTGYVSFNKYNRRSILQAIVKAIIDFHKLQEKSFVAGEKFYQVNNIVNYLDIYFHILNKSNTGMYKP